MADVADETKQKLNSAVEKIVERTVENGLGELVAGLTGAFPGSAGFPGGQQQNFGGAGGLATMALNTRGWLISNQRMLLSELYAEHGLFETVVDVPVHDALRAGYDIVTGQLSPEEITDLHADLEEDGTNDQIAQAMKWTRLYGGGGLVIVTDQDPKTRLDLGALEEGRPLEFVPFDMWELYREGRTVEDPGDRVAGDKQSGLDLTRQNFDYYGRKVDRSRVILQRGKEAPSPIRPRLQGWGLSVAETIISSVNTFFKTRNLTFEVLDEFKLDVYKIQGFTTAMLTKDGTNKILERTQLSNMLKNFQNALVLDKNDEHQSKQLAFTGIADVLNEIRIQLASDLRMPMTKLFGLSPAGFNTGDSELEVYNGMVESEVRRPFRRLIVQVVGLKCQQKFGFIPDDLRIKYKPLRILSAVDEENVKNSKFTRLTAALDKGLVQAQAAVDAINQDGLVGVHVDVDEGAVEAARGQAIEDADAADADEEDDQGDDGGDDGVENSAPAGGLRALFRGKANAAARVENPGDVDEAKWDKAKKLAREEYGVSDGEKFWRIVQGIYKKMTE